MFVLIFPNQIKNLLKRNVSIAKTFTMEAPDFLTQETTELFFKFDQWIL